MSIHEFFMPFARKSLALLLASSLLSPAVPALPSNDFPDSSFANAPMRAIIRVVGMPIVKTDGRFQIRTLMVGITASGAVLGLQDASATASADTAGQQITLAENGSPIAAAEVALVLANMNKVSLGKTDAQGKTKPTSDLTNAAPGNPALNLANLGKVELHAEVDECADGKKQVYLVGPGGQLPPPAKNCKRHRLSGSFFWGAAQVALDLGLGTLVATPRPPAGQVPAAQPQKPADVNQQVPAQGQQAVGGAGQQAPAQGQVGGGANQPAAAQALTPPSVQSQESAVFENNKQVLEGIRKKRAELEKELDRHLTQLRRNAVQPIQSDAELEAKGRAADEEMLNEQFGEYRRLISAELAAAAQTMSPNQLEKYYANLRSQVSARLAGLQGAARANLIARLKGTATDLERQDIFSSIETSIKQLRIQQEVIDEVIRRTQPLYVGRRYQGNATKQRLADLINRISQNYVEKSRLPSQGATSEEAKADEWVHRLERDLDIQEFSILADTGIFYDPETNQPITGELRDRIAKNAKLQLIEALQKNGLEAGVIRRIFGWTDSRLDLAKQLEFEVKNNTVYQALDLIRPGMATDPGELARALAQVIRNAADEVHNWRGAAIPPVGTTAFEQWLAGTGVGGWLYEKFWLDQWVGLETGVMVRMGVFDFSDKQIEIFEKESDTAVAALNAMARTPDPRKLSREDHTLLQRFGFIGKKADGTEYYKLPDPRFTSELKGQVYMPGAGILDVVSGVSAIKAVIMMAAPQMAAARVGALLEGLELLEGGTVLIRLAEGGTQIVVSATLDAASQKIATGKVEWDRLVLDNVVLGVTLPIVGRVTGAVSNELSQLFKDRAKRKLAESAIAQALGLTSDTVLMTYWQGKVEGTGMTYEAFLANLFAGWVGRSAPVVGQAGLSSATAGGRLILRSPGTVRDVIARLRGREQSFPEWFQKELAANPKLQLLVEQRRANLQHVFDEAAQRLVDVVGEDATTKDLVDPVVVGKITEALETGKLGFTDLKLIYGETMPWQLEPMMQKINLHRQQLFEAIVARARERAIEEINGKYMEMVDAAKKLTDPAARAKALEEADGWVDREIKLAQKPLDAPGSQNVTSDIDRSSASPFVRNWLKLMTDFMFKRAGVDPATSARAYDVNEYINVFMIIDRIQNNKADLSKVLIKDPTGVMMPYTALLEANSLAAAMMHMTPAERALFKQNRIKASGNDSQLIHLFDLAEGSLLAGENAIIGEIARIRQAGFDTTRADIVTRARDNLYGQRTLKLREMESRLETMDPNSAEAKQLAAQIQLGWSFALREGIEAYSDFVGLDVIVKQGQLKNRSIRDMIKDPNFTAKALGYTPEQFGAMINDQVMIMTEHMNAFHEGEESAVQAAGALGKYAERTVLALKLKGVDINSGPYKELNEISGILVKARKSPEDLQSALAKFGNGDADVGLLRLADMLQKTVPGLDGVWNPLLVHGGSGATQAPMTSPAHAQLQAGLRSLLLKRERKQEDIENLLWFGAAFMAQNAASNLAQMQAELKTLKDLKAHEDELAKLYRPEDWAKIDSLVAQRALIQKQIATLPVDSGATLNKLKEQDKAISDQLQQMQGYKTAGGAAQQTSDQIRREKRIALLENQIPAQLQAVSNYQALAQQEQVRMAQMPKTQPVGPVLQPAPGSTTPGLDAFGKLLADDLEKGSMNFPGEAKSTGAASTANVGSAALGKDIRPGDYVAMNGIVRDYVIAQGKKPDGWKVTRNLGGSITYTSPDGKTKLTADFKNGQIVIQPSSASVAGGGANPPAGGGGQPAPAANAGAGAMQPVSANAVGVNPCPDSSKPKRKPLNLDQFERMKRLILMQAQGVTPKNPAEFSDLPPVNELSAEDMRLIEMDFRSRVFELRDAGDEASARLYEGLARKFDCPPPTNTAMGGTPPAGQPNSPAGGAKAAGGAQPAGAGAAPVSGGGVNAPTGVGQPQGGNAVGGGVGAPAGGGQPGGAGAPGAPPSVAPQAPCPEAEDACAAEREALNTAANAYEEAKAELDAANLAVKQTEAAYGAAGGALEAAQKAGAGVAEATAQLQQAKTADDQAVVAQRQAAQKAAATEQAARDALAKLEACEQKAKEKCGQKSAANQPPQPQGGNVIGGGAAAGGKAAVPGGANAGGQPNGGNSVGGGAAGGANPVVPGGAGAGSGANGGNVIGGGAAPGVEKTCKHSDDECAELARIAAQKQLEAIILKDEINRGSLGSLQTQAAAAASAAERAQQEANYYHKEADFAVDMARVNAKDPAAQQSYMNQFRENQAKGDATLKEAQALRAKADALKAEADALPAKLEAAEKAAAEAWKAYYDCLRLPPCPKESAATGTVGNVVGGGTGGALVNTGGQPETTPAGFSDCPPAKEALDTANSYHQDAAKAAAWAAQAMGAGDMQSAQRFQERVASDEATAQRWERQAAYQLAQCNKKKMLAAMPGGPHPANAAIPGGAATPAPGANAVGSGNPTPAPAASIGTATPQPSKPVPSGANNMGGSNAVPSNVAAMGSPPPEGSSSACMAGSDACTNPVQCSTDPSCTNIKDICKTSPGACSNNTSGDSPYQLMMTASAIVPAKSSRLERAPQFVPAAYHPARALDPLPAETLLAEMPAQDDKGKNLDVSLVATGNSSGEAFQLQMRDPSGKTKRVAMPEGVVLEPVKPGFAKPPAASGTSGLLTQQIGGFCIQFMKLPPELGMVYKIAGPAMQQKFDPMRHVLQAGRALAEKGKLHPDSDPPAYADSIRQYAVWAQQEGWDEKKFGDNFVERTRKNAEVKKVKWSQQIESALRGAVPGRWRDITQVLDLARAWGSAQAQTAHANN